MLWTLLLTALLQGQPPCGWEPTTPPLDGTAKVWVPENGVCEEYYIQGPTTISPNTDYPLLVLFHSSGGCHDEHNNTCGGTVWGSYELIDWARDNANLGAFVMMHDGGDVTPGVFATNGSDRFQRATEAAIRDVTQKYPIDEDRIFGVGFSMGGGEALAYAARHLDPARPMLAGVVTQSGYLSGPFQVLREDCYLAAFLTSVYGTDYCSNPFAWQKAAIFDTPDLWCTPSTAGCTPVAACGTCGTKSTQVWPVGGGEIQSRYSQAVNIFWMPTQSYYVVNSVAPAKEADMVVEGNDMLDAWFGFASSPHTLTVIDSAFGDPGCSSGPVPPSAIAPHAWGSVCAASVVDFLGVLSKQAFLDTANSQGNLTLIAEDSTRFFHFEVTRADSNDFGRVQWSYAPLPSNQLTLGPVDGQNLTRLRIRADDVYGVLRQGPADPSDAVMRVVTPQDPQQATIRLEISGYPAGGPLPRAVSGTPAMGPGVVLTLGNGLNHDATEGVLWWNVTQGQEVTWTIPPPGP